MGGGGTNGGGAIPGGDSEYGNLPPQQRCRKIQQKLEELEADLNIKDQSQAGMQRMHVAYSQNPQLGDPTKVGQWHRGIGMAFFGLFFQIFSFFMKFLGREGKWLAFFAFKSIFYEFFFGDIFRCKFL